MDQAKTSLDGYVLQQLFLEGCRGARIGTAHSSIPNSPAYAGCHSPAYTEGN